MTLVFVLQYIDKEEIVLWMNTVGPYHNRQETYKYFSLPFCVGKKKTINHYHETLGEALQGVELEFSGLEINFKGIFPSADKCTRSDDTNEISVIDSDSVLGCVFFTSLIKQCFSFMITAEEVMQKNYCEIDLDKAKRDAFVYAIKNHYWYQMYIDDLPIWGK